jgi:hypothetical protein
VAEYSNKNVSSKEEAEKMQDKANQVRDLLVETASLYAPGIFEDLKE